MVSGQMEAGTSAKSQELVEKFRKLRLQRETSVKELAAKERELEMAQTALREVVEDLKSRGINSTDALAAKITDDQNRLERELTDLQTELNGVMNAA